MILGSVALIPDEFSGVAANARYLQAGDECSSGHYKCASFYFIFLTLCLKPLPPFIFIVAYVRIVFINVRLARALFYGIKER